MKILIDNGYGVETPGKRSPDGRFREYKYNREIARAVIEHLQPRGYDAELLVPEENDISLEERVRRANRVTCQIGHPVQETFLVSIHVNVAGSGLMWHNDTGWCAYTYYRHTLSDKLADCLYKVARKHLPGHRIRTDDADGDPDFEAPFYILKHTYCAAVLTENGFMDSEVSLAFLESDEGKRAIVALHVDGIEEYVKSIQ